MILQSGLTSIHRVGLNTRFSLPGDMFCNIDKISKVNCPVFIIHGTKDEIVPVHHGMELYNKCKLSVTPYWIEGGGHNNLELLGRREFYENVARFLKFVRSRGGGGGSSTTTASVAPHHSDSSLSSAALRSYKSNATVGAA